MLISALNSAKLADAHEEQVVEGFPAIEVFIRRTLQASRSTCGVIHITI
jgi:hypothetical protein